jgi:hypothetical protein
MVQLREIGRIIRKTPLFGIVIPEKVVNQTINPKRLPKNPSPSEYSPG